MAAEPFAKVVDEFVAAEERVMINDVEIIRGEGCRDMANKINASVKPLEDRIKELERENELLTKADRIRSESALKVCDENISIKDRIAHLERMLALPRPDFKGLTDRIKELEGQLDRAHEFAPNHSYSTREEFESSWTTQVLNPPKKEEREQGGGEAMPGKVKSPADLAAVAVVMTRFGRVLDHFFGIKEMKPDELRELFMEGIPHERHRKVSHSNRRIRQSVGERRKPKSPA